jgi:DNA-binding CsgD family transcriptional regulator
MSVFPFHDSAVALQDSSRLREIGEWLRDAGIAQAGLAAALDAMGTPSFVVRRDGSVLHASRSGAALVDRRGPDVREQIRRAIAGEEPGSHVARIDAPAGAERFLVVLRDAEANLRARLAGAAQQWRLAPRELEVLRWVVAGDSNKEIALKLAIHEGSIERHVTSLLRKTKCDSRSRLVATFWTQL